MAIEFDFSEEAFDIPSAYPFHEVPVRMEIAGIDLLEGYPIDLTDIAAYGLHCLRRAKVEGRLVYHPGERGSPGLIFLMDGDDVLVHSDVHAAEPTVRVSYEALVQRWENFADRVREFILRRFPGVLEDYHWWAPWLGGVEIDLSRTVSWPHSIG